MRQFLGGSKAPRSCYACLDSRFWGKAAQVQGCIFGEELESEVEGKDAH